MEKDSSQDKLLSAISDIFPFEEDVSYDLSNHDFENGHNAGVKQEPELIIEQEIEKQELIHHKDPEIELYTDEQFQTLLNTKSMEFEETKPKKRKSSKRKHKIKKRTVEEVMEPDNDIVDLNYSSIEEEEKPKKKKKKSTRARIQEEFEINESDKKVIVKLKSYHFKTIQEAKEQSTEELNRRLVEILKLIQSNQK